jgi:hypothetical protein
MRFSFAFASLAAVCVACVASCSSANFTVAPSGDGGTHDSGDGGADPCAPVDGIAKFCITVNPTAHPGYDSSTGASSLGLDGKGMLQLLLFSQDPAQHKTTPTIITYPPGESPAEVDIDQDFPITIAAPVTVPGTYWFVAVFEDDTTTTRDVTLADSSLPGDFETVPSFDASFNFILPQATLTAGSTTPKTLDIDPVRQVVADVTPTLGLRTLKTGNSSIHGDGPMEFVLYDGAIDAPTVLGLAVSNKCVKLFDPGPTGYPIRAPFNTFVTGHHSVLGVLFDYPVAAGAPFPSDGTILSPTKDTVDKIPTVDIGSAWSTEVEVALSQVPKPYPNGSTVPDGNVCP